MRNRLGYILIILLGIGCSKSNSDVFVLYNNNALNDTTWSKTPTVNSVSNTVMNAFSLTPFIDSFNVTGSALIRVNTGLQLAVPANALTYTDGSTIPPGKVRLEVRHLNRRGDLIRYAKPSTSYGKLMENIGTFEVKFFKQDQELALKPGKKLFFTLNDDNLVSTSEVYFGNMAPQAPLPIGTNPFFNWTHALDSSFSTTFIHQDSTGTTKGYQIFAGKSQWMNCQYPVDPALPVTNVTVTLSPNFTNNNTIVFVAMKQRKTVIQLNGDYVSHSFFAPNVPVGSAIQFVTVSLIGNQYYLGFKELTASQDLVAIVNPAAKSKNEISQFLSAL